MGKRGQAPPSRSRHSRGDKGVSSSLSCTLGGGLPPQTHRLDPKSCCTGGVVWSMGPQQIMVGPELKLAECPPQAWAGGGGSHVPKLVPHSPDTSGIRPRRPGFPHSQLPPPPTAPQCHPSALVHVSPPGPRMSPPLKERLWNPALSESDEGCNIFFPPMLIC